MFCNSLWFTNTHTMDSTLPPSQRRMFEHNHSIYSTRPHAYSIHKLKTLSTQNKVANAV